MEIFEIPSLDTFLTKKSIVTETYESCRNNERLHETEEAESRFLGITSILISVIAVIDVTKWPT